MQELFFVQNVGDTGGLVIDPNPTRVTLLW